MIPSPKLVKCTRSASSTTSLSGTRPAATNFDGAQPSASSTRYGGKRTILLAAVHPGPPAVQHLAGLLVLHEDAGFFQHLQRRQVDFAQLLVGEHPHLEPRVAEPSGVHSAYSPSLLLSSSIIAELRLRSRPIGIRLFD